jgi:hypothetical protein
LKYFKKLLHERNNSQNQYISRIKAGFKIQTLKNHANYSPWKISLKNDIFETNYFRMLTFPALKVSPL